MKPPLKFIDQGDQVGAFVDSEGYWGMNGDYEEIRYLVAAVNACHRAGLTVEQLENADLTLKIHRPDIPTEQIP